MQPVSILNPAPEHAAPTEDGPPASARSRGTALTSAIARRSYQPPQIVLVMQVTDLAREIRAAVLSVIRETPESIRPPWEDIYHWSLDQWPHLSSLDEVRLLVKRCKSLAPKEYEATHLAVSKTPIPVIENYVRIALVEGIMVHDQTEELGSFADRCATRLSDAFSWEGDIYDLVAPLLNFESPGEADVDISDRVVLRRVREAESTLILGSESILGHMTSAISPFLRSYTPQWMLVQRQKVSAGASPDMARAFSDFRAAIGFLRVFKEGQLDIPGVGNVRQPYGTVTMGSPNPWAIPPMLWNPHEPAYMLEASEKNTFVAFARNASALTRPEIEEPLGLAIQRVSEISSRHFDRDRVLDASTALEAVLLAGQSDELRFHLSQRGSFLLGDSPHERQRIFDCLSRGYARRNKLIHSGADKPKTVNTKEYCDLSRRAVRRAIELSSAVNLSQLCGALDRFALLREGADTFDEFIGREFPSA
jgi:hypothetical protein